MTYQGVVRHVDCHDARITIQYSEGTRYGWVTQHDFPLNSPLVRVSGHLHRGVYVTVSFEDNDRVTIREGLLDPGARTGPTP